MSSSSRDRMVSSPSTDPLDELTQCDVCGLYLVATSAESRTRQLRQKLSEAAPIVKTGALATYDSSVVKYVGTHETCKKTALNTVASMVIAFCSDCERLTWLSIEDDELRWQIGGHKDRCAAVHSGLAGTKDWFDREIPWTPSANLMAPGSPLPPFKKFDWLQRPGCSETECGVCHCPLLSCDAISSVSNVRQKLLREQDISHIYVCSQDQSELSCWKTAAERYQLIGLPCASCRHVTYTSRYKRSAEQDTYERPWRIGGHADDCAHKSRRIVPWGSNPLWLCSTGDYAAVLMAQGVRPSSPIDSGGQGPCQAAESDRQDVADVADET